MSVPVLSRTTVSTAASRSSGSPPLIRTPAAAPRPVATMTAVGTARPIAHGHAMIRTATAAVIAWTSDGSAGTIHQIAEVGDRNRDHHRDEDARDAIGQALDRRLRPLGIAHQANDLRQHAGGAHRRGFDLERTGRIDGGADDAIAGLLLDRQRFAGQHRLVHGAGAAADDAVHGESLAGADEYDVASADVGDGNLFLAAITPDAGRGWLQGRQVAQRARRLPLGPRFHRVAQQHQRDDQDDRFVVDVGSRTLLLQRRRRDRGRERVQERRAGPDRDQRVHVGIAMPECGPGPGVEGGARPQHHERRHRRAACNGALGIDRVEPWQHGTQRRIDDPHGPGDRADRRYAPRVRRRRP